MQAMQNETAAPQVRHARLRRESERVITGRTGYKRRLGYCGFVTERFAVNGRACSKALPNLSSKVDARALIRSRPSPTSRALSLAALSLRLLLRRLGAVPDLPRWSSHQP